MRLNQQAIILQQHSIMRNYVYLQLSCVNIPGMDVVVPTTRVHRVALIKENIPTLYSHDLTIKYFIINHYYWLKHVIVTNYELSTSP